MSNTSLEAPVGIEPTNRAIDAKRRAAQSVTQQHHSTIVTRRKERISLVIAHRNDTQTTPCTRAQNFRANSRSESYQRPAAIVRALARILSGGSSREWLELPAIDRITVDQQLDAWRVLA